MERKIFFGMTCNIFFELWVGNIFCGVMVNICVVGIVHFFFGGVSKNVWAMTKYFWAVAIVLFSMGGHQSPLRNFQLLDNLFYFSEILVSCNS